MSNEKSQSHKQDFSVFRSAVLGDTLKSSGKPSPDEAASRVLKRIWQQAKFNKRDG